MSHAVGRDNEKAFSVGAVIVEATVCLPVVLLDQRF
jgi:hypothetical protein